jgi:hypothetical protein
VKAFLVAAAVVSAVSAVDLVAACAPERMVRIVVEDQSPSISRRDFAAKPKTVYRYQSKFARVEEAEDTAGHIHGLTVVSEPDSWIVNLMTGTGTHLIDRKEPYVIHLPVLGSYIKEESFPSELVGLEFGCEIEFFDRWKSPEEPLPNDPEGRLLKRAFGIGLWKAVMLRQAGIATPFMMFLFKGEDIVLTLRYTAYEFLPPDPRLFERPSGVSFKDLN